MGGKSTWHLISMWIFHLEILCSMKKCLEILIHAFVVWTAHICNLIWGPQYSKCSKNVQNFNFYEFSNIWIFAPKIQFSDLTGRLWDSGPTSPRSKWRCPKCYTMIIPPMGGDHFGMGPGAQRSSVAEIAIFRFFSSDFCFTPGAPIFGPCFWKVSYKR